MKRVAMAHRKLGNRSPVVRGRELKQGDVMGDVMGNGSPVVRGRELKRAITSLDTVLTTSRPSCAGVN